MSSKPDPISQPPANYVSAREAAALLDVKLATLYAYTSRGLVESIPSTRGRARLYRRRDLERLRARRDARAGHGPVAAGALQFGEPVLDSAVTAISPERGPLYRGHSALVLARTGTPFEVVAELLFGSELPAEPAWPAILASWQVDRLGVSVRALRELLADSLPPLTVLALLVPLLASRDPGRFSERPEAVLPRARVLIRRMAAALALARPGARNEPAILEALGAGSIAHTIAVGLGARGGARAVQAIDAALVLAADHELNASTFAARVAASTGADVFGGITAALVCLAGPRHGGAADRVEALVAAIGEPGEAERIVHERQRRGEIIDGFGHPLYPEGDPRGATLVELARELAPPPGPARTCLELVDAMQQGGGGAPTVDTGLVALALALELPPGSAGGLFSVARSAGWVAHILEQYAAGYLVRPRARYLGPDCDLAMD